MTDEAANVGGAAASTTFSYRYGGRGPSAQAEFAFTIGLISSLLEVGVGNLGRVGIGKVGDYLYIIKFTEFPPLPKVQLKNNDGISPLLDLSSLTDMELLQQSFGK